MKRRPKEGKATRKDRKSHRLYTLEVFLLEGPINREFARQKGSISRTIEIPGDHTLETLHNAIFRAFDREEDHLYEFQFGKRPNDREGRRCVLPMCLDDGDRLQTDLTRTTLDSLGLEVQQVFGYWFDFGDDWWHGIRVLAIGDRVPPGEYPRVTAKIGESPPQYPDPEEEEGDEEDEEDPDEEEEGGPEEPEEDQPEDLGEDRPEE